MATQEKPRKRIVPQLIAASPTKLPDAYEGLPPPSPQLQVTDLREQAEFAKEHLGLDRKIYVDLRPYQEHNKAVNWKQVRPRAGRERGACCRPAPPPSKQSSVRVPQLLKERGAKPAGKVPRGGPGEEPGAGMDLMSRVRCLKGRGGGPAWGPAPLLPAHSRPSLPRRATTRARRPTRCCACFAAWSRPTA